MKGFFAASDLLQKAPPSLIAKCGKCGLFKTCISPKMPVSGCGKKKILIIGEGPGETEDRQGRPFVGPSGQMIQDKLGRLGIDLREDCWITNAIICRAKTSKNKNRTPTYSEIKYCRPNVIKAIQELQPEKILLFGGVAVESLIGWIWKENTNGINRWLGYRIPCQKINAWICPTWHPSFLLHKAAENNRKLDPVQEALFEYHLERAVKLKGRPFATVPNYKNQVTVIEHPEEAAHEIKKFKDLVAFDYEAESLKPDRKDVQIVSCAISDGVKTISYPWAGKAIQATKSFLENEAIGKIGTNIDYETRWSFAKLGIWVRNWKWDTMQAAHVIDNRPGITSLKFQAFALLGQGPYDDHIKPFFSSESKKKGANEKNRIHEIGIQSLLLYNGLDALLEYLVARKQMKQMGVT